MTEELFTTLKEKSNWFSPSYSTLAYFPIGRDLNENFGEVLHENVLYRFIVKDRKVRIWDRKVSNFNDEGFIYESKL